MQNYECVFLRKQHGQSSRVCPLLLRIARPATYPWFSLSGALLVYLEEASGFPWSSNPCPSATIHGSNIDIWAAVLIWTSLPSTIPHFLPGEWEGSLSSRNPFVEWAHLFILDMLTTDCPLCWERRGGGGKRLWSSAGTLWMQMLARLLIMNANGSRGQYSGERYSAAWIANLRRLDVSPLT